MEKVNLSNNIENFVDESSIHHVLDESPKSEVFDLDVNEVDFLEVDVILSKNFNQSCDEIYGAKTTFLSKSEGVFVSSLGILMAYRKGKAQEKHNKSTWQSGV